jgi:hypothetical protein
MVDAVTLGGLRRLAFPQFSTKFGQTAFATGGQTGATAIVAMMTQFSTVASAGDSALLPASHGGRRVVVTNAGANAMNLYPVNTTDAIDGIAAGSPLSVPPGNTVELFCIKAGQWYSDISATDTFSNLTLTGNLMRSNAAAVAAAGTTQGTATALTADQNNIATGTANQGVILPTGLPGMRNLVWNSTGATIKIYPPGTGQIDAAGASTAVTLTSAHRAAEFFCQSANTWVSAIVGAAST